MKTLGELLEPTVMPSKEEESRSQFEDNQRKLLHQEWLRDSQTKEFLAFMESRIKENTECLNNLVDSCDSTYTRTLLTKETQTLTKLLNYARRKSYSI